MHNPSFSNIVTLAGTMKATAAVRANRLVTFAGAEATAADAPRGVSNTDASIGQQFTVNEIGELSVEAGAVIAVGQPIGSDAEGRAVPVAVDAVSRIGRALSAAAAVGKPVTVLVR